MDAHLARARLLLEQSRYDLAEQELRQALAAEPNDPLAHALLALCLAERKQFDEATAQARTAIHHGPDDPFGHYVMGVILLKRRRPEEAGAAAGEALLLDPENAAFHALSAQAFLEQRRWPAALEAAEAGLRIDPENVDCTNLRAMALVKLGRHDEAGATIESALARDPENPATHANQGWTLLHQGDPKKAMEHFREALRLDPTDEWSKAGIIEALKARNILYGLMLKYFLFMGRLSRRAQWFIILGGYFGNNILTSAARSSPDLAPWLFPIRALYIAFAVLTWVAYPLFNLSLRLHPIGRHALSADQRSGANWTGAFVAVALSGLMTWLVFKSPIGVTFALTFGLSLMALTCVHVCDSGWPRRVMAFVTAGVVLLGLGLVPSYLLGKSPSAGPPMMFFLAALLAGFLGNGLIGMTARR